MVRADGWKYCYYVKDKEELYNLEEDPLELTNLAGKREYRDKETEMRHRLFDWLLMTPYRHRTDK
jgi:arylsulfatase A-like enzyme